VDLKSQYVQARSTSSSDSSTTGSNADAHNPASTRDGTTARTKVQ
jgi:hypothetical protein